MSSGSAGWLAENIDGWFVGAVEKELASPVKEVLLARIHMRGDRVLVCRGYELSIFSSIWPSRLCNSAVFFCCRRVCACCLA